MTNPDDKQPDASSNAPSWVDEVLGGSSASPAPSPTAAPTAAPKPAGADDLRIPDAAPRAAAPSWVDEVAGAAPATPAPRPAEPAPAPSWVDAAVGTSGTTAGTPVSTPPSPAAPSWVDQAAGSSAAHTPQPQPAHHVPPAPVAPTVVPPPRPPADDDWVARATGGAKNPSIPQGPAPMHHAPSQSGNFDDLERQARQAINQFTQGVQSGDVAQKKLIAGLLAIFLGGLGVHKFYLGNTQPGVIMLAATIGGWFLGIIGSFIIVGAVFFLVPFLVGLLGLVEGIIYLTKSDADFQREYITGKKAWL